MDKEKYLKDTQLIVKDIIQQQSKLYDKHNNRNNQLLSGVGDLSYIEKAGPVEDTKVRT